MTAKVQPAAGIQVKVQAAKAASVVRVHQLSRAEKVKKQLPSKAAATSTMMKAANRILIAKMQIGKLLQREGRIVQEVIVLQAEIAVAVAAAGIVVEVLAVAGVREAAAIAVLVVAAVEIAAIAK